MSRYALLQSIWQVDPEVKSLQSKLDAARGEIEKLKLGSATPVSSPSPPTSAPSSAVKTTPSPAPSSGACQPGKAAPRADKAGFYQYVLVGKFWNFLFEEG